MDSRLIVERFRSNPEAHEKLGEGHKMTWGDDPSSTVYQVPGLSLVLKTYRPHENKDKPLDRARHEFAMIQRVSDLPGAPHVADLIVIEDTPYLLREAGVVPDHWSAKHILQVQDAIEALFHRGMLLGDAAQAVVRDDGSAFIYDLESAILRKPTDSRMLQQYQLEDADASFWRWLRAEGFPERPLRLFVERKIQQLEELESVGLIDWHAAIDRYQAMIAREDLVKAKVAAEKPADAADLWSHDHWGATMTKLEKQLSVCRDHISDFERRLLSGLCDRGRYDEAMQYLTAKQKTLQAQASVARARSVASHQQEAVA